ncbi:septum formation initiator, partial [Streptomyces sp. NPDC014344]
MAATAGRRGEGADVERELWQGRGEGARGDVRAQEARGGPGDGPVGPLIVTEDPVLLDDLLRL